MPVYFIKSKYDVDQILTDKLCNDHRYIICVEKILNTSIDNIEYSKLSDFHVNISDIVIHDISTDLWSIDTDELDYRYKF